MPRFFFHLTDGEVTHDDAGVELATLETARLHAAQVAAEALTTHPEHISSGDEMRVEVTDASGTLLFSVVTTTIDSPSLSRRLKV